MITPAGGPAAAANRDTSAIEGGYKHVSTSVCKRSVCLHTLFVGQNEAYFHNLVDARIGFGPRPARLPRRRQRRSIVLGSYSARHNRIRIHPVLGEPFVPPYVTLAVVFHEMLHAYLGIDEVCATSGRRRVHTAEFRAIEQSHPCYAKSLAWEQSHLKRLLAWPGPSSDGGLLCPCHCSV